MTLRTLAEATPASRDRVVDLLRALAIVVVVLGHWTVSAVMVDDGVLSWVNLLNAFPWTHPLTWVAQVMPLVFLVGGWANAASWTSHRARGGTAAAWVRRRAMRLLRPTVPFLLALVGGYAIALAVGTDLRITRAAVWLAAISLWFLVVYLAVVGLGPLLLAAHDRWGLRVVAALVVAVGVGDVLRVATGSEVPAAANYLLAWVVAHQLGVAWHDGVLDRSRSAAWWLLGGGVLALLVLTGPGPYGVTMVGAAPEGELSNTAPPTLALLALTAAHTGLVLLLREPLRRWAGRPRVWRAVVVVNATALTLYLWHMVPVVILGTTLVASGAFPQPEVGSGAWFAWRLPWLLLLAAVLAVIVALVGRFELGRHRTPSVPRREPPAVVVGLGVVACLTGLLGLGVGGTDGLFPAAGGVPVTELVLVTAGVALLGRTGRPPTVRASGADG